MPEQFTFSGDIVWRPAKEYIERAHLTAFMREHGIEDFDELMSRSTSDVAWFTDAVLKYLDIQFYKPYSKVIDTSNGFQFPKWCVGGEINIVHNLLDKRQRSEAERQKIALLWEGEEGAIRSLTYQELYEQTNKTANA